MPAEDTLTAICIQSLKGVAVKPEVSAALGRGALDYSIRISSPKAAEPHVSDPRASPTTSQSPDGRLAQRVVRILSDAIIEGSLEPGTKLNEERLAEDFGISRTPVREALRELAADRLVTLIPRRGATVTDITARDAAEIYVCRAYLQGLAAKKAARRLSKEEGQDLIAALDLMKKAVQRRDVIAYFRLHVSLYDRIMEAADDHTLRRLVSSLGRTTLRFRFLSITYPGRLEESLKFQEELIDALIQGDGERAEQVVHELIGAAGHALLTLRFGVSEDEQLDLTSPFSLNAQLQRATVMKAIPPDDETDRVG